MPLKKSNISYHEESHTYFNSAMEKIPSASELVRFALGDEYPNVPKAILVKAAERGILVHNAIQSFIELTLENYECEKIVDYQERFGGRFDVLQKNSKGYTLIDIKTNSKYPKEHLEWQMGFYSLAINRSKIACKCLYIPNGKKAKYLDVTPKSKEECLEVLERYEKENSDVQKFY